MTGVYAAGLLAWNGELLIALGGLKLVAYGTRKHRLHAEGKNARVGTSVVRILCGIVIPLGAWIWNPDVRALWAIALAGMGDLIDRCEYYAELDVATPRRQMIIDLWTYQTMAKHAQQSSPARGDAS
jgi:hypothetical protein